LTASHSVPRLLSRVTAATLTVVLLWVGPSGASWIHRCIAGAGPPAEVPLVVVLGPEGSEDVPVAESLIPAGFLLRLRKEGYSTGVDLHSLRPGPFQDLPDGSVRLASFVNDCIGRSPSGTVDIVACEVSGFVLRLALEGGLVPAGAVRNLIMVASPNRGTFLADLLKSIVEIVKHESLLEKETRAWRYLPIGEELMARPSSGLGSDDTTSAPGDVVNLPDWVLPTHMAWEDETTWVAERVRQVYEPLYARYVEQRYLALPYLPAESPKETFAGWIKRAMPDFWDSAVKGGILPPAGPDGPSGSTALHPGIGVAPPPGRDLTTGYYEVLAMEVARNQYVMRLAAKGSVLETLLKEPYVPRGWKDGLLYYGIRMLQYYARKALVTLKSEAQNALLEGVMRHIGFLRDSASPMLRRLVKDELLVNLGTSTSKRFERLPANSYLASLNDSSMSGAAGRKTRYVSLAARLSHPWSLVWPQLGPNDLFLEVDSSVAPAGPRDCLKVFPGLLSPSRDGLLGDARAQDYIISLIRPERAQTEDWAPRPQPGRTVRLNLSSWRPSYAKMGEDGDAGGGRVDITLPEPPAGWQYQVWTEAVASGDGPTCLKTVAFAQGGTFAYTPAVPGGVLGLRLVRSGPLNPVLAGTVGSAYATEIRVEGMISPGVDGSPVSELPATELPEPVSPEAPDPGGQPADGTAPPPPDTPPGGTSDSDGDSDSTYPLVRVVNRSKRTTHKQPRETYHEYWTLDFGDGTTQRIDGSPSLCVSHTFSRPGAYRVRAESYDARVERLLAKEWPVNVTGGTDATRQFTCTSVARLRAEAVLTGPVMWVTGKPAVFAAALKFELPPHAEVLSVEYDPGPKFAVLWERAGGFQVSCAATVRLRYLLEDETVCVENTYVRDMQVEVLTTGVTR